MTKEEKAILVSLDQGGSSEIIDNSIEELALLADTAGAIVLDRVVQKRTSPDRAYYIGRGKTEELAALAQMRDADLIIFNDELSPSQIRNLDRILGVKVVDRTNLILDIFARRALSREGKLQVELAQLQYLLPRLIGLGNQLSRLGGGIGTRGPGETQLEVDRRVIRRKISELEKEIVTLRKHRQLHRARRKRESFWIVSLVGYTNAGKSTLLNTLTGADLYTEDKLFATLDPMVRRGVVTGGKEVLFTDTVGFIEKLPDQLVTAFQATLEEVSAADILLHVVDISHHNYLNQIKVVREHLSNIKADYHQHEMIVFNKLDLIDDLALKAYLIREFPSATFVSATRAEGITDLKDNIAAFIDRQRCHMELYLPYSEGKAYAELQERGKVEKVQYKPDYLQVSVIVDQEHAGKFKKFRDPAGKKNNKD